MNSSKGNLEVCRVAIILSAHFESYDQIFTEKVVSAYSGNVKKYVIPGSNGYFEATNSIRYFMNKKVRYLWNENTSKFEKTIRIGPKYTLLYISQTKSTDR